MRCSTDMNNFFILSRINFFSKLSKFNKRFQQLLPKTPEISRMLRTAIKSEPPFIVSLFFTK